MLHSSAAATHSAFGFLNLVDRLTAKYKSFKYLNHRLVILKEIQSKLFEIYEEDLIRSFQENWRLVLDNAARGGIARLMLDRRAPQDGGVGSGGGKRHKSKLSIGEMNPLPYWRTHCGLLNSIYFLTQILKEWNDEFIFLELYYFYTHKQKIQSSFFAAWKHQSHHSSAFPQFASSIGGLILGPDEEDVFVTSEELALWISKGGNITTAGGHGEQSQQDNTGLHGATNAASTSHSNDTNSSTNEAAHVNTSLLPPGFDETFTQLRSLKELLDGTNTKSSAPSTGSPTFDSTLSAISTSSRYAAPTSDTLFPKSSPPSTANGTTTTLSTAANAATNASSLASSSSVLPIELTISGTLFGPILTGYTSLQEEMLSSLVQLIVNHFRESIREYAGKGHMVRDTGLGEEPLLSDFFRNHNDTEIDSLNDPSTSSSSSSSPLTAADWSALDSCLDISPSLCTPLVELKTQLIVVHQALTRALHRTFWTQLANKLSQVIYKDVVEKKYFTRSGSLQFMRDMRAIFVVFEVYAPQRSSMSRNPYFKLLQDTINLLLLSPTELHHLDQQLTTGSIATGSSTTLRTFLARPPYLIQRMTPTQVIDLIAHMRTETEDARREEREQAQKREVDQQEGEEEEETEDQESDYGDETEKTVDSYGQQLEDEVDEESLSHDDDDDADHAPEDVDEDEQDNIESDDYPHDHVDDDHHSRRIDHPNVDDYEDDENEAGEFEEPNMDEFGGFPEVDEDDETDVNDAVPQ